MSHFSGVWNGGTCTVLALNVGSDQVLTINDRATVQVLSASANFGTIAVTEGSQLIFGERNKTQATDYVNIGSIVIMPEAGHPSPKVINHMRFINQGTIFNALRDSTRGIFENNATVLNQDNITNNGAFRNYGRVEMLDDGFFDNQNGTLRNEGTIAGLVHGDCSGACA